MIKVYSKHLKRGTIRAMASNLPMPKTSGLGETECNQRGYEQDVTTDRAEVTCQTCQNKLANFDSREIK